MKAGEMQKVSLPAAILQGQSGPGTIRVEYVGPYAGGVTVQVPGGRAFVLSNSPVNKYAWATEQEAKWLTEHADCRRIVVEQVSTEKVLPFQVQPIVLPKLEEDKPVPTPTADKVAAMVEPAPPTVKEALKDALPYDGKVWAIDPVEEIKKHIVKRRGRKPKAK